MSERRPFVDALDLMAINDRRERRRKLIDRVMVALFCIMALYIAGMMGAYLSVLSRSCQ